MINRSAKPFLALPRPAKRALALTVDTVLCFVCVWLAFGLRLDSWRLLQGPQWWTVIDAVVLAIPMFISAGLYRAIFRYSGMAALMALLKACAAFGLLYFLVFTLVGVQGVPRSIGVIVPLLVFATVGLTRLFVRYWLGGLYAALLNRRALPQVLIYGAGMAGRQTAAALANSRELTACAFIDDSAELRGTTLNGLRIYPSSRLPQVVEKYGITDVLLAMPSVGRARRAEIVREIQSLHLHLHVRTLPGLMNLAQGRVQVEDIRELDIEDLLGRDPVPPDEVLLNQNIRAGQCWSLERADLSEANCAARS